MKATEICIKAYAKLNLTLEILGRRPDYYHEICSVVQTVSLADEMTLRSAAGTGTMLRVQGYPVPQGDDNLAMVAVRLVESRLGESRDLEIQLNKKIPPGRGLGGGSSDAAAILRALGCLQGWTLDRRSLEAVAAETGSDVPLFLRGGLMLIAGRGERVMRLPEPTPQYSLVAAWPDVPVPTGRAYGLLEDQDFTDGSRTDRLWEHLRSGGLPEPDMLYNGFERVIFENWEPIARLHARLSDIAGVPARLTGSGSSVFVITPEAESVAEAIRAEGYNAVVAHPVDHGQDLSCSPGGEECRAC